MGFECESIGPENACKLICELRLIIEDGGNMKLPTLAKVDTKTTNCNALHDCHQ